MARSGGSKRSLRFSLSRTVTWVGTKPTVSNCSAELSRSRKTCSLFTGQTNQQTRISCEDKPAMSVQNGVVDNLRRDVIEPMKQRFVGRDEVVDLIALAVVAR